MDAIPTARATLEMELDGAAPAGRLTSRDGVGRGFSGWSELAAAIEEWRTEAVHPRNDLHTVNQKETS